MQDSRCTMQEQAIRGWNSKRRNKGGDLAALNPELMLKGWFFEIHTPTCILYHG